MLKVLKKDNKVENLDLTKINNVFLWSMEEEKPKWYNLKARWNNYWKIKNTFNPFDLDITPEAFADSLEKGFNTTPEEEAEKSKFLSNMLVKLLHPYTESQIDENVFKYTHDSDSEKVYYKVNEIEMSPEEYQQYLDKKALNKKLSITLKPRVKTKQGKI